MTSRAGRPGGPDPGRDDIVVSLAGASVRNYTHRERAENPSADLGMRIPMDNMHQRMSTLLADLARAPSNDLGDDWEAWLHPGATVGRFELLREIGRGGFGIVWEARDRELRRGVAFKAVRAGDRASLREEALVREAEAVAQLTHPNLVTLYDVGRCEHGPYLVLELLRGQPLSKQLEKGKLTAREALHLAIEVAKGLAHAHAAGVVHRDLKPANVLVCKDGQVKVLDFGFAHAFGFKRINGGTPAYMAPEQWEDAPEDERTDIFALGVLLYRALSGELPFAGKSSEDRAPRLDVPDLPQLGTLVGQMMARDPRARPRNGAALLSELQRIAALLPPDSDTTVESERTGKPMSRLRAGLIAVAALVVLGLACFLAFRPPVFRSLDRSVAVLPFQNLSPENNDELFADGIHSEIITQLGKIAGLKVIARSSVVEYRQQHYDLQSVAQAFGVKTLLEGTIRRVGNRVRISVALFDAATGRQLWAEDYDRTFADTLKIQTDVALEIARTLGMRLSEEEMRLLERPPTKDAEAYDAYRRALTLLRQGALARDPHWKQADEFLEQAVARDPSFALAHAWLAISAATGSRAGRPFCERARMLSERALTLGPDLPEAHAAVGVVDANCKGDFQNAVREIRIAERVLQNDAYLRTEFGQVFWRAGDESTALEMYKRAFDLDPRSFRAAFLLATHASSMGAFADAGRGLARAHELSPEDIGVAAREADLAARRDGNLEPARKVVAAALVSPQPERFVPSDFEAISQWVPREGVKLAAVVLSHEERQFAPDAVTLQHWHLVSGRLHFILGQREESRSAYRQLLDELAPQEQEASIRGLVDHWNMRMAVAKAGVGLAAAALEHLKAAERLLRTPHARDEYFERSAEVAVLTNRPDAAFAALGELIARRRRFTAALLRVEPFYASLRRDPRFEALLEEPEPISPGIPQ